MSDQQQTLGGEVIEESPTDESEPSEDGPPIKPCDICGRETVLDGDQGIEHGGQVLCDRGCAGEPVAFVAHCRSCGWFYEVESTEFNRHAVRTRVQQERGSHERFHRVLELIQHDVAYREVATDAE